MLRDQLNVPMIIIGNFNEVLKPEERKGRESYTLGMHDFSVWVQEIKLIDLPLLGKKKHMD